MTKPVPRSILKRATVDSAGITKVGRPMSPREPRQDSPNTKRKNYMKNIYKRILRPGSRAEQLLIQNGENSERMFLKLRAKSAERKHGLGRKSKTEAAGEKSERPQLQFDPERICPCPANEEIIPTEKELLTNDDDVVVDDHDSDELFVYDDFEDDEPSSNETVTLLPINRQTVKTWEVGMDKTTICYRLGTTPRPKPHESNAISPTLDVTPPPIPGRVITTPVKSPTRGILNSLPPPPSIGKKPLATFSTQGRSTRKGLSGNVSASPGVGHGKWSNRGTSYIVDDSWALTPSSPTYGKNVTFDTINPDSRKRLKKRSGMRKTKISNESQLRTSELLNHLENLPMLRKFKT